MKFRRNIAAAAILAVSFVACYGQSSETQEAKEKQTSSKKDKGPTVEEQIQALRQELQGQIDSLKTDLANKDAQLKMAQEAAASAQAAAAKAQAAAMAEQQAASDNAAAVTTLQTTVTDLKGTQASLAATVSDETAKIKKEIASPAVLHYKGIGITPGGYAAGETVWRSKATGGDIPTAFSSIPYEGADAYKLSEFFGSARQSRVTLLAEGKTNWGTLRGYYEADWLGTGITSNNNQSNSYVLRQRVLWAQAETNSHLAFTGGQLWSLATEDKKGISNLSGDILTPQTIDPNYVTGFVWTRQYGFRVTKTFDKVAIGVAAENPQLLYTASLAGNEPYAVLGSAGQNGGNYNAAISASATTTYIQNYSTEAGTKNVAGVIPVEVPVYKTAVANTNIANLSFNEAPDVIVKVAVDPGIGHYEIFGIGGFAHETVYPGVTTNSTLYGGVTDITTGAAPVSGGVSVVASSSAGAISNSIKVGGFGASARVPVLAGKLTFGAKGLFGPGVGRYGDSTLADVTANASGLLAPIHNLSGLLTVEANPTPRMVVYLNYGGDYAARTDYATPNAQTLSIASKPVFCPIGGTGAACINNPTAAQLALGGAWGAQYTSAAAAVGYGSRFLGNSGCNTVASPGYNGSSTGYYPGGSCGAQTRDVQEITGGWWYDIYKGDRGRFRQGFQYGYAVREGWSGASGIGAKGIDNMFWTSLRYYLP
ncbi:MAG: hypothetical protein ABSC48_14810 [Terracidiphilus sp.]|jgi:hypothetical protein